MQKTNISIILSIFFTMFIVAPTVISAMETGFDVSVFYSLNEEEEQSENKSQKQFEIKYLEAENYHFASLNIQEERLYNLYINDYATLHLENFSPPPEY
ncbi:MAG: hypothetical protein KC469_05110 [Flavobacteriaceae bacterium]|nr:hypothetical protein [Flavobacteriaceae bacterium]